MKDNFEITITPRKIRIYYFIAPFFLVFTGFVINGLVRMIQSTIPMIGKIVMVVFLLIPIYIGLTCMIALIWMLIGKEHIKVDSESLTIKKRILFIFYTRKYKFSNIDEMYVNSNDYRDNKIFKSRNDFLSVFKLGTIHFKYSNRLIHIAGGLTDEEAKEFLGKLLPIANRNKVPN